MTKDCESIHALKLSKKKYGCLKVFRIHCFDRQISNNGMEQIWKKHTIPRFGFCQAKYFWGLDSQTGLIHHMFPSLYVKGETIDSHTLQWRFKRTQPFLLPLSPRGGEDRNLTPLEKVTTRKDLLALPELCINRPICPINAYRNFLINI